MQPFKQEFTTRQYMVTPDYEYFHYADDSAIEVEYHHHDFYEIYFLISGKVTYIIEGKSHKLKPGDILLIHSRELHKPVIEAGEAYNRIVLWVNPEYLRKQSIEGTNLSMCFETDASRNYTLLRPNAEMSAYIKALLGRLERAWASTAFGCSILRNAHLLELMVYLNRAILENFAEDLEVDIEYNQKINSIITHINERICEDLPLDKLSAKFYMSKYHLLREFKKHTGCTIHSYICQKRLILATQLLKKGLSVTDTCSKCGFGDYSNFIRSFKKLYGFPPHKYIKGNGRQ